MGNCDEHLAKNRTNKDNKTVYWWDINNIQRQHPKLDYEKKERKRYLLCKGCWDRGAPFPLFVGEFTYSPSPVT